MAQVGGVYVSLVTYSVPPVSGTDNVDLTRPTGNGVSFPSTPDTTAFVDKNNEPVYQITVTFNPAGVDSLSSIITNADSNVKEFSVEFFSSTNPNQPFTSAPGTPPLSYTSSMNNSQASIVDFSSEVPSPLTAIKISILSTKDDQ